MKCLKLKRASSYFVFPRTILGLIYISSLAARLSGTCLLMSPCCNSVNKSNLQFSGHTFIYKQSVGDLSLAQILKHVIIPQKRQVFHYKYWKTPHWRFQTKSEIVATQVPELGQTIRWNLFEASFLAREADNPMTRRDFDWVVSNHAVWGWKDPAKASGVRRFSPSALPFSLPPFPFSLRNTWYSG